MCTKVFRGIWRQSIFILISLFFFLPTYGQTKAGIGVSYNLGFFQHEDYEANRIGVYEPDFDHSFGINTFLDFKVKDRFQLGLKVGFGKRRISLSDEIGNLGTGVKNRINFEFIFADLSIMSSYELLSSPGFSLYPTIGFFLSLNYYDGLSSTTSSNVSTGQNNIIPDLRLNSNSIVPNAGINLGLQSDLQIFGKSLMPFIMFYWSPSSSFFDMEFVDNANMEPQSLKGRLHYLSTGVNIPLNKKVK